jgi:hypothetical protein
MSTRQQVLRAAAVLGVVGLLVSLAPSQASAGWRQRTVVVTTPTAYPVYAAPAATVYPAPVATVYPAPVATVYPAPVATVVASPVRAVYAAPPVVASQVVPSAYLAPTVVRTRYAAPVVVRQGPFRTRVVYPRSGYLPR